MFGDSDAIQKLSAAIAELHSNPPPEKVLPDEDTLRQSREKLVKNLPEAGLGLESIIKHLQEDIVPGLNASSRSSNYYGFVTGGSTPAASLADNFVTAFYHSFVSSWTWNQVSGYTEPSPLAQRLAMSLDLLVAENTYSLRLPPSVVIILLALVK